MARRLLLNSRMGLDRDDAELSPPLEGFSGPGSARVGFGEFNQRNWLTTWSSHLTGRAIRDRHVPGGGEG